MLLRKKIICTTCNGEGSTKWDYESCGCMPVKTNGINICPTCGGSKEMINPAYVQVCEVLEHAILQMDMKIFLAIFPLPLLQKWDTEENKEHKFRWPMFGINITNRCT